MKEETKLMQKLKQAKEDLDIASENLDNASAIYHELLDQVNEERVSTFDKKIVKEALRIGVNPHNFETEKELDDAIVLFKSRNEVADKEEEK